MSYFGGLVGIVIAFYISCRVKKIPLLEFSDLFVPPFPSPTLSAVWEIFERRIIWPRDDKTWGMYFPLDITGQLRHRPTL